MNVVFKQVKNALIIKPEGEIDAESAKMMRRKIDIEYDTLAVRDMIFDMTNVWFMDSSGIGMIIGRYKRVKALNGVVKIFGADKTVRRIIELSGLGTIVKVYTNEKEAVGADAR